MPLFCQGEELLLYSSDDCIRNPGLASWSMLKTKLSEGCQTQLCCRKEVHSGSTHVKNKYTGKREECENRTQYDISRTGQRTSERQTLNLSR